jgi:hypothetical protein
VSRGDRWLLAQCVLLLPLTGLALRWLGFRRCLNGYAGLARLGPRRHLEGEPSPEAARRCP